MNHDGPVTGTVIDARLQAIHAQRVTVGALIAFLGTEQAQAGLMTAFGVGELGGEIFTGLLPVGDQVAQYQGLFTQVENPQASGRRGLRVVDDGQVPGLTGAIVDGALHGTQGTF